MSVYVLKKLDFSIFAPERPPRGGRSGDLKYAFPLHIHAHGGQHLFFLAVTMVFENVYA